jgi:hypothetical protein
MTPGAIRAVMVPEITCLSWKMMSPTDFSGFSLSQEVVEIADPSWNTESDCYTCCWWCLGRGGNIDESVTWILATY